MSGEECKSIVNGNGGGTREVLPYGASHGLLPRMPPTAFAIMAKRSFACAEFHRATDGMQDVQSVVIRAPVGLKTHLDAHESLAWNNRPPMLLAPRPPVEFAACLHILFCSIRTYKTFRNVSLNLWRCFLRSLPILWSWEHDRASVYAKGEGGYLKDLWGSEQNIAGLALIAAIGLTPASSIAVAESLLAIAFVFRLRAKVDDERLCFPKAHSVVLARARNVGNFLVSAFPRS